MKGPGPQRTGTSCWMAPLPWRYCDESKSPSLTPRMKACHSSWPKRRTGPFGFFESRTATCPSVTATSTQWPLSHRRLRRHCRCLGSISMSDTPSPSLGWLFTCNHCLALSHHAGCARCRGACPSVMWPADPSGCRRRTPPVDHRTGSKIRVSSLEQPEFCDCSFRFPSPGDA